MLSTFQNVEDQRLALHSLQEKVVAAEAAVEAAKQATAVALDQYKAGTVAVTPVIVANQSTVSDQQTLLPVQQNRLVANVTLSEALGGGWESLKN